ncbi:endonuclease, partial [Salmonella enterica subsp. enterica serovar Muenster]|nr:endonuclease [Salmonella enterica subsp. enterica serovar Muenster]
GQQTTRNRSSEACRRRKCACGVSCPQHAPAQRFRAKRKQARPQMTQFHIINNWLWLGAVPSLDEAATLVRTPAGFDQDGYKI